MSDSDLYLYLTQVDPEPTKPVVGFRPHQSSTQPATEPVTQKGIPAGTRTCCEQCFLKGQPLHSISHTMVEVYPYILPP